LNILINLVGKELLPRELNNGDVMNQLEPNMALFNDQDLLNLIIKNEAASKNIIYKYGISGFKELNYQTLLNANFKKPIIIQILAIIELINRVQTPNFNTVLFNNAKLIYENYQYLKTSEQEHFYVLYLNYQKQLIKAKCIYKGTINMSIIHPRDIFKEAFLNGASFIICLHNHPSGIIQPSIDDLNTTKKLNELGKLHGVILLDHIIIGDGYYSFFEQHML